MSNQPKATLSRTMAPGGFNTESGTYNRYKPAAMKWRVFVFGETSGAGEYFFIRKKDAVAVFDFVNSGEWDLKGDLSSCFEKHMWDTLHDLRNSYKGEF